VKRTKRTKVEKRQEEFFDAVEGIKQAHGCSKVVFMPEAAEKISEQLGIDKKYLPLEESPKRKRK
jgi:hypothetical protein